MRTEWNENRALLTGEVLHAPEFSHASHGEDYFLAPVKSLRLSGAEDVINVMMSRSVLDQCAICQGDRVTVEGEVRSYNNRSGTGNRLVLTLYAKNLSRDLVGADENRLTLAGTICRKPVYRRTPLGREIADLILAVNRRYGRADYLPCIAWGTLARECAEMDTGTGIRLEGRFQSRAYIKVVNGGEVQKTAYEVSIMTMQVLQLEKSQDSPLPDISPEENCENYPKTEGDMQR